MPLFHATPGVCVSTTADINIRVVSLQPVVSLALAPQCLPRAHVTAGQRGGHARARAILY